MDTISSGVWIDGEVNSLHKGDGHVRAQKKNDVGHAASRFLGETREAFVAAVAGLARFYHRSPDRLGEEEIRDFFLHLINERKAARSTVTIYLCGIKFFYEKTIMLQYPADKDLFGRI